MTETTQVTNNLRTIIKEQGRQMQWLAKTMKVSRPTILNWCNNETQPNITQSILLIKQLDVKLYELFNFENIE